MELNRTGIIDRLRAGVTTIDNFNYDKLTAPPMSMIFSQYDIDSLYNIATSVRYSGNTRKKYKAIDEIMTRRDFKKLSAGTNRLCYKFLHDDSFVTKIAYDSIAIQDSPAEFRNQFVLKPFCTKVFEVDPCGVIGSFERVDPITSREEFMSVADDAYYLIDNWLQSDGHIMADVGTKYFMNYGLRRGFGLVIIDFPYLYEIDGNKLFCTSPDNNSDIGICGGKIDFDPGFNEIYCEKCGTMYRVKEISKDIKEEKIIVKGGHSKMGRVRIMVDGKDISQTDPTNMFKEPVTKVSEKRTVTPVNSSHSAPKVNISTRPVRTNNYKQKKRNDDDGYVKPAPINNSNVKVEKKQPPQRRSSNDDYRGRTSTGATGNVTEAEANYIANDNAGNEPDIAGYEKRIDTLSEELRKASEENENLKKSYEQQLDANNTHLNMLRENISKYEKEISELTGKCEQLEQQASDYKSELESRSEDEEKDKINMDEYVSVQEHDRIKAELELKIDESAKTIKQLIYDSSDFCDFAMRINDHVITCHMESDPDFEAEKINGANNLDATVTMLSSLIKLEEGQADMPVLAFKYKDGSLLCGTDGKVIVASSIGGISLGDLTVENNAFDCMEPSLFQTYFSDEEGEEPAEEASEDKETTEEAEEVSDNAKNADAGEN